MLFCWILKGGGVEEDHRKPAKTRKASYIGLVFSAGIYFT